jgi:aminopeptidase
VDERVTAFARLLVERALGVQPGWQVLVRTTPLGRPLLAEIARLVGERDAYLIPRVSYDAVWPINEVWTEEAPLELVRGLPEIDLWAIEHMDARITIVAPENTRAGTALPDERRTIVNRAERPFYQRQMVADFPWCGTQFPTQALAQDAGMTLPRFENFFFGAVLQDWDAIGERMRRLVERFDAAEEVRIVGKETDLRVSIAGRDGDIDDGHNNLPGGEFFYCPVEDSAEGEIAFLEFPANESGHIVEGARLRFRGGRVIDAAADDGEDFLLMTLDTDDGARRLGELGIGCNPGITRHMQNALFDEKIAGTVHVALGQSYESLGGTNQSAIHWDIVKDLRAGGQLWLDGELVQENGEWVT